MARNERMQKRVDAFFADLDYWLLVPIILITLIGLVTLNAVLRDGYGSGTYPLSFYKQVGAVFVGVVLAFLICLLDAPTLRLFGALVYGVSLVLLVYVKVDGYSLKALTGADSWIRVPIFGSYQPSELAKLGIIIVVAYTFSAMRTGATTYLRGSGKIALTVLVPLGLILKEPDFGTGMVIVFTCVVMLFVWGVRWRYIVMAMAAGVVAMPLLWKFALGTYQKNRILTYLFPGQDKSASYHIHQSLAAIRSGGLAGVGQGPKTPVPVKESDFIFTAVSENMGLIGTTVLLGLIIAFVVRAVLVAYRIQADGRYAEAYIMIGAAAFFSAHFIENIGMCVGVLPITGIPLPFFSDGGSSMVASFITFGVMLNIAMNERAMTRPRPRS